MRKLSGPILDRIDLGVHLRPVPTQLLLDGEPGECSAEVRGRVVTARAAQQERGQPCPNAQLDARGIARWAPLDRAPRIALQEGAARLGLTGRSATRCIKVARTIADLECCERIEASHIAQALQFKLPRLDS